MTMTSERLSGRRNGRVFAAAAFGAGVLLLGGCGSNDVKHQYPEQIGGSEQHDPLGRSTNTDEQVGSIIGRGGLLDFKGSKESEGAGIGVNSYLWRATLDTLSFMPLATADPFGGVIITDWYNNPQAPSERFKVTVYILDKKLRADGIKVSIFRQLRSGEGVWVDQQAADDTRVQIENAILTRARQLRVSKMNEG
jgi:hypothetical protein